MPKNNHIYAYYQAIKDGKVIVGRWLELIYERIIRGLEAKDFFFDSAKANDAIDWIETHCFHTEGPLAPGPLLLELWQKAFVSCVFGIVDQNGNPQYREIFLVIARKQGKSAIGAAICRYVWTHGGFGSNVFVIAPKLEQADIVYKNIWVMTTLDPEWKEKKRLSEMKDVHRKKVNDDSDMERHQMNCLYIPSSNATVKKIAYAARRSDGFNPSISCLDELAAWEGNQGLHQYEVMKSGMGARPDARLLGITTSGYVNDGIYDELMKRSTRYLLGESEETRLLPLLYMIDDPEKCFDINELQKSNPNLGVSVSVDYLLEEIAIAKGSFSKKGEFLCKYCCIKSSSSTAWLDAQTVQKATGEHLDLDQFRNSYAVAGIDLSQTTDLTSCCVVIEKEGTLNVIAKFFLPGERIQEATERDNVPYAAYIERGLLQPSGENFVDYKDCYNWFTSLIEDYQIYPLQVGYDRYSAQYLIQDLKAYGFQTDDVLQSFNLWPVIQEMEGLLKDGKINIGDNDLLKMHLLNAALKMDNQRGKGRVEKINATAHIDGCAALLDALTVRQKWYSQIGEQLKNQ